MLNARILVSELLFRRRVDKHALRLLSNLAIAHGLRALHHHRRGAAERIVEGMPHVGIFGQYYVVPGGAQALHKPLAGSNRIIVVGRAVKIRMGLSATSVSEI